MLNKFFASLSWLLKTLTNLHLAVKNGFSFVCQFTVYFKQIINELNIILQGSKLTVVRLSRTTKITMGQPNCAKWLPLGQPNLLWH